MTNKCSRCGEEIKEDESTYIVEYGDSCGVEEICELCSDKDQEDFEVLLVD